MEDVNVYGNDNEEKSETPETTQEQGSQSSE